MRKRWGRDVMSPEKRSALMSRIRGKNTGPERLVEGFLRKNGIRFKKHQSTFPGKPDFVLYQKRVVLFVDGDFWHGWRFPLWRGKLKAWWREKIQGNRDRDIRNFKKVRRMGWKVVRIWEHQLNNKGFQYLDGLCLKQIRSRKMH
jgi:DNA mismatch endonuclease, patch repair protein